MDDIIDLLQNVYLGMDGISVAGISNQRGFVDCANGVKAAIAALQQLQRMETTAKPEEKEATDG